MRDGLECLKRPAGRGFEPPFGVPAKPSHEEGCRGYGKSSSIGITT